VLAACRIRGRPEILTETKEYLPGSWRARMTVAVFGAGGRVELDDGQRGLRNPGPEVTATVLRRGESFVGIVREGGSSLYAAYVPLRDVFDAATALRKRTTALFTTLIAAGMIFGFVMSFLFSAWLVRPIGRLASGVARVAGGDLEHKVRVESEDELGELTDAFNRMVQSIRERDLRLREMTESRLTMAEKQVSIGRLAAGVAHEINNPLTAMLTLSMLWLKKLPPDDPRRGDVGIIVAEATRCREIVQNLLDFARERPVATSPVDINSVIESTLALARNYAAVADVELRPALSPVPLIVNADPKLLRQVFINLLINSAEAVERGGVVRVETDEDSSGGFVQVRVADDGKGIPAQDLEHVFEPFFTTKPAGKGTGLGLSVSLGIVQKHGGTIEIRSEAGRGTTVTVLLPRVSEVRS
jgi:two-component system NtrC family sensor kinase